MRHNRSILLVPDNIENLDPVAAKFLLEATVDSLRDWERLGGECGSCKRHGLLNKYDIRKRFGLTKLVELQPLLHCMGCNNPQMNRFIVVTMARD